MDKQLPVCRFDTKNRKECFCTADRIKEGGEAGNILEAHTGAKKVGGFTSLPLETGAMGLNDRMDFMNMFQKQMLNFFLNVEKQNV